MYAHEKSTMGLPQSPEPGSIIRLHAVSRDAASISAERLAAQRPAAEAIARVVRRWAAEDEAACVAEARR